MALFIRHHGVKAFRHQGTKAQNQNILISTRGALLHLSSNTPYYVNTFLPAGGYYVPGNAQIDCIQWFPEKRRLTLTWPVLVSKFKVRRIIPPPFFPELQVQMQVQIGNGKDVTMSRYQVVEGSLLAGSSMGMCWLRPPESGVDLGYTHLYQFIPVALPTPFLSFLFFL